MKYNHLRFAVGYLKYYLKSGGRHKIHSPFVYALYEQVIKGRDACTNDEIKAVIHQCLKDSSALRFIHPGSGALVANNTVSSIAQSTSKPEKYRNLLYRLARYTGVKTGLEIGTSLGFSTMYLAAACPDAKWITLEGADEIADRAAANFSKAGLTAIRLVRGRFGDTLAGVLDGLDELDFVFIDGHHQPEPTLAYFEACLAKRSDLAVFVIDDINWSPGMQEAWKAIKSHPDVVTTIDLYMLGIVYFDKSLSRENFLLRF